MMSVYDCFIYLRHSNKFMVDLPHSNKFMVDIPRSNEFMVNLTHDNEFMVDLPHDIEVYLYLPFQKFLGWFFFSFLNWTGQAWQNSEQKEQGSVCRQVTETCVYCVLLCRHVKVCQHVKWLVCCTVWACESLSTCEMIGLLYRVCPSIHHKICENCMLCLWLILCAPPCRQNSFLVIFRCWNWTLFDMSHVGVSFLCCHTCWSQFDLWQIYVTVI